MPVPPNDLAAHIARLWELAREHPWQGRGLIDSRQRLVTRSPRTPDLMISALFSLDYDHHGCGWWRNSDDDRCWHLGICGFSLDGQRHERPDEAEMRWWARRFLAGQVSMAWIKPPASVLDAYRTAPASSCTWHVRVSIDRDTGQPIIPKGEVYTLKPWAGAGPRWRQDPGRRPADPCGCAAVVHQPGFRTHVVGPCQGQDPFLPSRSGQFSRPQPGSRWSARLDERP